MNKADMSESLIGVDYGHSCIAYYKDGKFIVLDNSNENGSRIPETRINRNMAEPEQQKAKCMKEKQRFEPRYDIQQYPEKLRRTMNRKKWNGH